MSFSDSDLDLNSIMNFLHTGIFESPATSLREPVNECFLQRAGAGQDNHIYKP
jgi:hypothetical protein